MSAPFVFLPGWCVGRGPELAAVDALHGTIIDLIFCDTILFRLNIIRCR